MDNNYAYPMKKRLFYAYNKHKVLILTAQVYEASALQRDLSEAAVTPSPQQRSDFKSKHRLDLDVCTCATYTNVVCLDNSQQSVTL